MALSEADRSFQAALVHHQAGRREEAIAGYRQVLMLAPGHGPAQAMLASLGGTPAAAVSAGPQQPPLPASPGELLEQAAGLAREQQFDQAVALCRRGREQWPADAELPLALARFLVDEICYDDNVAFAQAESQSIAILNRMGQNLVRHRKMLSEAVEICRGVIARSPGLADAHGLLGHALSIREDTHAEAAQVFRQALALDPANELYRYRLAILTSEKIQTLPADIVQQIFDSVADRHDEAIAALEYHVPRAMRQAVTAVIGRVADLGCGTGVCGPLFREGASRLVGVDLSPNMLAEARKLGVYDDLRQAELHEFLAGTPASFDLILAADVLIYVGDLSRFMPLLAAALVPGGRAVFSVEKGADGFRFLPTGRFQHAESYVRGLAVEHGFSVEQCLNVPVRLSGAQHIPGQLFVLRRG